MLIHIPIKRSIIKELRDYNTLFFRKKTIVIIPTCSSQIQKHFKKHITKQHIEEKINEINSIGKSHKLTIEEKKRFNHLHQDITNTTIKVEGKISGKENKSL